MSPPGTRVGEFELIRVLGQGGFGIVYEAHEPTLDRRVALKEYFPAGVAHRDGLTVGCGEGESREQFEAGLARFVREARLLALLNERARQSASLVAVYRVFQANGTAYMAMKLYDGKTLRRTVAGQTAPVSEPWLIGVLLRVLDALEALHSLAAESLVHRDVSPDNIILEPDGNPVLLDFGATRKATDAQTSMIYKPGYSPLEQYTEAQPLGPWTDLYALCATAYFAIARRSPVPAIDRYAGVPAPTASETGAGRFSPEFLAIVDRGMEVLPGMRWQTAADLRSALTALPSWRQAYEGTVSVAGASRPDIPLSTAALTPTATAAWLRILSDPTRIADDDEATRALPQAPHPAPAPAPTAAAAPESDTITAPAATAGPGRAAPAPPRPAHSTSARLRWSLAALAGALMMGGAALWTHLQASRHAAPSVSEANGNAAAAPKASTPPASGPAVADSIPACLGPSDGWSCVLGSLQRMAQVTAGVSIRSASPQVAVGDPIRLELTFSQRGRVRVYAADDLVDAPMRLIFPNALDRDDQVGPDAPLTLPRGPHWKFVAQPPRGRMWLVAVLLPDGSPAPQLGSSGEFDALRAGLADGQTIRWLGGAGCERAAPTCAVGVGVQFAALDVQ